MSMCVRLPAWHVLTPILIRPPAPTSLQMDLVAGGVTVTRFHYLG